MNLLYNNDRNYLTNFTWGTILSYIRARIDSWIRYFWSRKTQVRLFMDYCMSPYRLILFWVFCKSVIVIGSLISCLNTQIWLLYAERRSERKVVSDEQSTVFLIWYIIYRKYAWRFSRCSEAALIDREENMIMDKQSALIFHSHIWLWLIISYGLSIFYQFNKKIILHVSWCKSPHRRSEYAWVVLACNFKQTSLILIKIMLRLM